MFQVRTRPDGSRYVVMPPGVEVRRRFATATAITRIRAALNAPRCADCGEHGQTTGHMGCQYPQDRD